MAIEYLYPDGDKSTGFTSKGGGDHYIEVDDSYDEPDDDGTYVYRAPTMGSQDCYTSENHSEGSGTINSLTIYVRAKKTDSKAANAQTVIGIDEVGDTKSDSHAVTTSYADYSDEYNQNPWTSSAWTWSEIDNLYIGLAYQGDSTIRCTQVYIAVDYTPSAPVASVELSITNRVNPNGKLMFTGNSNKEIKII